MCYTGNRCSDNVLVQDVVFVISASGRIDSSHFQLIREFIGNITTELIRNSPRSAVGVISFGSGAHIEFNLQAHTNLSALLSAIDLLQLHNGMGNTPIHVALNLLSTTTELGLRNSSSKVAIIVTDRMSSASSVENELHALNKYNVFAVIIGGDDQEELRSIASSPKLVFFNTDYTGLKQLEDMILPQLCIGKYPMTIYIYVYIHVYIHMYVSM